MAVVVLSGHKSMGWQGRHEGGSKIHTRMSKKPLRPVAWSIPRRSLSLSLWLWGLLSAAANDIQRHQLFLSFLSFSCVQWAPGARSQRTKALPEPNIIYTFFLLRPQSAAAANLHSKHCSSPSGCKAEFVVTKESVACDFVLFRNLSKFLTRDFFIIQEKLVH